MQYKHIVFDLDGTLIDTERAILPSLRDTVAELTGRRYEEQELTFALGITGADALERLGVDDAPAALSLWNEKMHRYDNSVSLFDGVVETLIKLREQGLVLGIVTSKTREEFTHDFNRFGIGDCFQTVVCAEETVEHKPSPAPLLKCMELSGVPRERVLYANRGKHYVRGHYSRNGGRDGMGSYSSRRDSRGRYSRDDGRSEMMEHLEMALDSASDQDRETIKRFMRQLENA